MKPLEIINAFIVAIGIPAIVGALVYIGKKLQLLDSLDGSMAKAKRNLKVISDYLTRHHAKFDPRELESLSPLNLTNDGMEFIVKIGFDKVFEGNKEDFLQCIDSEHPKLKYDVEIAAIKSIYFLADKPYMDFLKVFFYNTPARTMENTAPTLGVYVRDKYLEAHPQITE